MKLNKINFIKKSIKSILFICLLSQLSCTQGGSDFSNTLGDTSGGVGTASVAITSFSPGVANPVIKKTNSQQFIISAVGNGTLLYTWKLDNVNVGTNSPTYTLDANSYSAGVKTLSLTVNDDVGSVTQSWSVKINGTPVVSSISPALTTVYLRHSVLQNYSVTATDPNSDTLTYVWKLDGQENILTSILANTPWTPATIDVGSHTVSVDIYDGVIGDAGTYKVTQSWTTYVNNFSNACNVMETASQTNKACYYVGIPGIGDGQNPLTNPTLINVRPAALAITTANNLFIADDINHVVWFWNKNTSPSITTLGVTVPINQMKIVAGIGMASTGNSVSNKALRNYFNSPSALLFDGTHLYVSDTSNNRVRRIDSAGVVTDVLTAGCTTPRGLAKFGSTLYVACAGLHIIRAIDVGTLAASTFAGVSGSAANPAALTETTFTDAGDGRLNVPYGVAVDASGNVFVGEYTGCRVRMYNTTGSTVTLYGTYNISPARQRIVLGGVGAAVCANTTGEPVDITAAANARTGNIRHINFNTAGQLMIGHDLDAISVLSFGSGATIMGVVVPANTAQIVFGNGTAAYLGEGLLPAATRYNNPFQAVQDSATGDYYVADYSNGRLRKVQTSDFKTDILAGQAGSQRYATNAGQGQVQASLEKMSNLRGLTYDHFSGELFMADLSGQRIRVASRYGEVTQAAGTGALGSGAEENDYPSNVTMNQPRGITLTDATTTFGGHLVWADNLNHRIRILNRKTTDQTLFGVLVEAGKVATIGGNGATGNATSGTPLTNAFNAPSGVTFDGVDLYVADTTNHCIKKISSTGVLSAVAGTCGTVGNANGPLNTARFSSPESIEYYENGTHKGIVIGDQGNNRVRFFRIAGSSILFGGPIAIGDTNSIACGGTYHTDGINAALAICSGVYGVTVAGTKVCYTNYNYHNVRCIKETGEVSTVMGALQGIDDNPATYFPGTGLASEDFDLAIPNFASQNGVVASFIPSPLAEPLYSDSLGALNFPITIKGINANTLFVGEYQMGMVRKVKIAN